MMIAIEMPDGSILTARLKDGVDPQEFVAEHAVGAIRFVELPTDPKLGREFRNAWSLGGDALQVDMPRARQIHLERLRKARDQELDKKDKDFTRAHGKKNQPEQDRIEAERENLRNLPQTVNVTAATTPQELLSVWPTELAAYDPKTGDGPR